MTSSRPHPVWPPAVSFVSLVTLPALLSCAILLPGGSGRCSADDESAPVPAIVIPSDPKAPTVSSEDAAVLAWNMATLYVPASKAPDHPAKTEELAALTPIMHLIAHDSAANRDAARSAIATALAAGSKDVLIAYVNIMLSPVSRREMARQLIAIYPQWKTSPYPPVRRAYCSMFILSTLSPDRDASYPPFHEWAYQDVFAALATFPEHEQSMVRGFFPKAKAFFADAAYLNNDGAPERIIRDLSAPGIAPWWSKSLQGVVEIDLAWQTRGGGYANTVTDQQWKGYGEHLAKAQSLLTAAWNLEPERPEAATQMITVAMGGTTDNGTIYDWFNRAVAAQMDDAEAYDTMLYALMPRWGGSYEDMLRLGSAGAQTGRFDTRAPWELITIVRRIYQEDPKPGGVPPAALTPVVYSACQRVIAGYQALKATSDPESETTLADLAWMCGHQAGESLKHLDAAGTAVDESMIRADLHLSAEDFRAVLAAASAAPPGRPAPAAGSDTLLF